MIDYLKDCDYIEAEKEIQGWANKRNPANRKSWEEVGLSIAREVSNRSPDCQTKVGAYLTTKDHRPISTGFNGFPSGVNDEILPNMRPDKHLWIVHAEVNTILNAAKQGRITENSILYCTHIPCKNCLLFCWQAGIHDIIYSKGGHTVMTSEDPDYLKWVATFDLVTGSRIVIRGI